MKVKQVFLTENTSGPGNTCGMFPYVAEESIVSLSTAFIPNEIKLMFPDPAVIEKASAGFMRYKITVDSWTFYYKTNGEMECYLELTPDNSTGIFATSNTFRVSVDYMDFPAPLTDRTIAGMSGVLYTVEGSNTNAVAANKVSVLYNSTDTSFGGALEFPIDDTSISTVYRVTCKLSFI